MAIYPAGKLRNIPPGVNDPAIIAMGAILHVDSGNSGSLYSYFNGPSGGIESHFFIRKDGVVEQYRDTAYEADANLHANSFSKNGKLYGYVSIETQGFDKGEWNATQLDEIKKLLLWLSHTHNFPLKRCANPTDPGVGYHVMFGAPGPWTPVAKDCPGPDRVKQYNTILVPWFKNATIPPVVPPKPPVTPPKDESMSAADVQALKTYISGLYDADLNGTAGIWHAQDVARDAALLAAVNANGEATHAALVNLTASVDKLVVALTPKA